MITLSIFSIGFAVLAFWIWAAAEIALSEFKGNDKIVWLLLVLLIPFIGTILYFAVGRSKRVTSEASDLV